MRCRRQFGAGWKACLASSGWGRVSCSMIPNSREPLGQLPSARAAVGRGRGWGVVRQILALVRALSPLKHPPPPTSPLPPRVRAGGGRGECTPPRSRRMSCARFFRFVRPSRIRGRRECRAPDAPDSRVCRDIVVEHTRCQVTPESPGIPRAMVLTASFAISPATGLSCHRRPRKLLSANLTPASGRQDHATSPSASGAPVMRAIRVHRIPLRVS
jgi:hypothetical protein